MFKIIIKTSSLLALIIFFTFSILINAQNGEVKGLNKKNIDMSVSPTVDFFEYANGNWLKNNPIPDEYSRWGSFEILAEENYKVLREILESAAKSNSPIGSNEQKIGDFYYTGMNTVQIEKEGFNPIKPDLKMISELNSIGNIYKAIAYLHKTGVSALFNYFGNTDVKNSEMVISQLSQGGLSLPDRDYYTNNDERSTEIREEYVKHIAKMLVLIGQSQSEAEKNAQTIMNIEARLAKSSRTRVERRDPDKNYNKMSLVKLEEMTPGFKWDNYFNLVGMSNPGDINVGQPDFFKEVAVMINDIPVSDWKTYLNWKVVDNAASYLSSEFENQNFEFYGKFLSGSKILPERWKRVMRTVNGNMGEALGQIYVEKTFPPEAKERANKIVHNLLDAMGERIKGLEWMSDETKKAALIKLSTFIVKIGYPD